MNAASTAVLTAVIVLVGRWSQKKPVSINVVVGGMVMMFVLAAMPAKLAKQFSWLILAAALFTYGEAIFKNLPLTDNAGNKVKAGGGRRPLNGPKGYKT